MRLRTSLVSRLDYVGKKDPCTMMIKCQIVGHALLDIVRGTRTKEDEKSNIENTWIYKRAIGSFFFVSCRTGLMCISHLRNGFEFDSFKRAMFAKKT